MDGSKDIRRAAFDIEVSSPEDVFPLPSEANYPINGIDMVTSYNIQDLAAVEDVEIEAQDKWVHQFGESKVSSGGIATILSDSGNGPYNHAMDLQVKFNVMHARIEELANRNQWSQAKVQSLIESYTEIYEAHAKSAAFYHDGGSRSASFFKVKKSINNGNLEYTVEKVSVAKLDTSINKNNEIVFPSNFNGRPLYDSNGDLDTDVLEDIANHYDPDLGHKFDDTAIDPNGQSFEVFGDELYYKDSNGDWQGVYNREGDLVHSRYYGIDHKVDNSRNDIQFVDSSNNELPDGVEFRKITLDYDERTINTNDDSNFPSNDYEQWLVDNGIAYDPAKFDSNYKPADNLFEILKRNLKAVSGEPNQWDLTIQYKDNGQWKKGRIRITAENDEMAVNKFLMIMGSGFSDSTDVEYTNFWMDTTSQKYNQIDSSLSLNNNGKVRNLVTSENLSLRGGSESGLNTLHSFANKLKQKVYDFIDDPDNFEFSQEALENIASKTVKEDGTTKTVAELNKADLRRYLNDMIGDAFEELNVPDLSAKDWEIELMINALKRDIEMIGKQAESIMESGSQQFKKIRLSSLADEITSTIHTTNDAADNINNAVDQFRADYRQITGKKMINVEYGAMRSTRDNPKVTNWKYKDANGNTKKGTKSLNQNYVVSPPFEETLPNGEVVQQRLILIFPAVPMQGGYKSFKSWDVKKVIGPNGLPDPDTFRRAPDMPEHLKDLDSFNHELENDPFLLVPHSMTKNSQDFVTGILSIYSRLELQRLISDLESLRSSYTANPTFTMRIKYEVLIRNKLNEYMTNKLSSLGIANSQNPVTLKTKSGTLEFDSPQKLFEYVKFSVINEMAASKNPIDNMNAIFEVNSQLLAISSINRPLRNLEPPIPGRNSDGTQILMTRADGGWFHHLFTTPNGQVGLSATTIFNPNIRNGVGGLIDRKLNAVSLMENAAHKRKDYGLQLRSVMDVDVDDDIFETLALISEFITGKPASRLNKLDVSNSLIQWVNAILSILKGNNVDQLHRVDKEWGLIHTSLFVFGMKPNQIKYDVSAGFNSIASIPTIFLRYAEYVFGQGIFADLERLFQRHPGDNIYEAMLNLLF